MEPKEEILTVFGQCLCCLQYGYLKHMWSEHKWNGEQEMYGDMLIETFGIAWETSTNSDHICEYCIKKVREAYKFKKEMLSRDDRKGSKMVKLEVPDDMEYQEDIVNKNPGKGHRLHQRRNQNDSMAEDLEDDANLDSPHGIDDEDTLDEEMLDEEMLDEEMLQDFEEIEYLEEDAELVEQSCKTKLSEASDSTSQSNVYTKRKRGALTRNQNYSAADLKHCVDAVMNETMSQVEAVKAFNVPSKTLNAQIRKLKQQKVLESFKTELSEASDSNSQPKIYTKRKKGALTRYKNYSAADLKECVDAVMNETMSQVEAAKAFNVPSKTLNAQIRKLKQQKAIDDGTYSSTPEIIQQRENIASILQHTNATPIKVHWRVGYSCCFCPKHFYYPEDLKKHTYTHEDLSRRFSVPHIYDYIAKLDMTGLTCKICNENIDQLTLEEVFQHIKDHGETYHTNVKNHILPFKFDTEDLICTICKLKFEYFNLLSLHMREHYENYRCKVCNKGFIHKKAYKAHSLEHNTGIYPCKQCPKQFRTKRRLRAHNNEVHITQNKKIRCRYCNKKFRYTIQRRHHEVKYHETGPKKMFQCEFCDKVFDKRRAVTVHIKNCHVKKHLKCSECDMRFSQKNNLRTHMVTHTKERNFACDLCEKRFGTMAYMKEHKKRVHDCLRTFVCPLCDRRFTYKWSLKKHMSKSHNKVLK